MLRPRKNLATPLLTTNKIYYLRQLWTYNFCIHEVISGKSYMYTWNETTAARGSQEVGSCLVKYSKQLPPGVKHLVAYSDSCGGQNKNKNIAKLFMYVVQCTSLERIDHKFYESGHSQGMRYIVWPN
uniref:Uncharacterized protein LOC114334843 n=1 Tax=Diabrotica virgifera virgifera TaxID=50390 RepID=A0A6P7FWF9_DIAVI